VWFFVVLVAAAQEMEKLWSCSGFFVAGCGLVVL